MTDDKTTPNDREPRERNAARMTVGEHLDELRGCLIRSLAAFLLVCILCIWPAKYLLALIVRPAVMALREAGQPDNFLATGPVEPLMIYIKVVLIVGLIISAPYIIYQFWTFVATGLYDIERKWVFRLVPQSSGLFLAGVLFMYVFVLPVSLRFLVGFGAWLPLPNAEPSSLERLLMGSGPPPTSQTSTSQPARVPVLEQDPETPPPGSLWFNSNERKLKTQVGDETYAVQLGLDSRRGMVTTHFRIGEYLSFVLILTIAFGLAFQIPLVVIFLVGAGIVSVATFRSYRKVVILVIVIIAGILAPPDLMSHLLLSGPMILLFELGLWLAARKMPERRAD